MFFLLRCLFWISLVFVCLPPSGGSGGLANVFVDVASAVAGTGATKRATALVADVATEASDRGAEWCKAHSEACVDAVLAAMVAKTPDAKSADVNSGARGAKPTPTGALGLLQQVVRWPGAKARG